MSYQVIDLSNGFWRMGVEADQQFNYGHILKSCLLMMFKMDPTLIIVYSKINFSDSFWRM
jgi:hypothetical protein